MADTDLDAAPVQPVRPAHPEASRRSKRVTLIVLGLMTIPICVAMIYGTFGDAASDGKVTRAERTQESVLYDDADKSSALGPTIALTVLGIVVAGCVAVPLVRARRVRRSAHEPGEDAGDRAPPTAPLTGR